MDSSAGKDPARRRRGWAATVLAFLTAAVLPGSAGAAEAGDLDSTFAGDGTVTTRLGVSGVANDIVV